MELIVYFMGLAGILLKMDYKLVKFTHNFSILMDPTVIH